MKYTKRATIIILTLIALAAEIAAQGSRIMLTQLERAPSISGSRKGMIGLSNANGDQRYAFYVNVADTCINYTPSDTGNATVSIFVQKCATDSIWYIDYEGRSILLAPYGAASDTCDVDWLEIADNNCPDALTDSIYKYKYASIGARYVWPGAELLVNDSVASGIAVVQGSRNARLALYDSQSPGTFFMIDHGGSAPVMYMPVNANLIFKTTAGTPQTPVGSQVNHFAINTQDSTIQMYRYPNTRTDTQSVVNFLYTDPVGKVRSRPITYIQDSLGIGQNIYNSNGTIPPDINRYIDVDTNSSVSFRYPTGTGMMELYSGTDSTANSGYVSVTSPNEGNFLQVDDGGIGGTIDGGGEIQMGDRTAILYGTGMVINVADQTFRAGDPFGSNSHGFLFDGENNYTAMYYSSLGGSYVQLGSNQVYDEGQDVGIGWIDGYGIWIASQNQTEVITQNSQEFSMYGGTYSGYLIAGDTAGQVAIYGRNTPEDRQAFLNLDGNASGDGYARANLTAYDASAPQYTIAEIILDTAGVGINTRGGTGNDGDVLTSNGSRTYWAPPASGGTNIYNADGTIEAGVQRNVQMDSTAELNFLYANGDEALNIYAGDDGSATSAQVKISSSSGYSYAQITNDQISMQFPESGGTFEVQSSIGNNALIFSQEVFAIQGADTQGSEATYTIQGDTTSAVLLAARRNVTDQSASLTLSTTPGGIVTALLQAYNADAPRTTNAVQVDTSGVGILTQGSDGAAGQVLQSDGDKSYWGVTIEDGIIGADMLSYNNLVGWETVNANRALMATTGGGSTPTLTPSVGVTEIMVTDTATTSTVNLNYVPGDLDGATYAQPFTTVRYIYNWGSGDCTVDTNQDWTFRIRGDGTGNATLTIPAGESYKLIWVQGSSEATSSFWCIKID